MNLKNYITEAVSGHRKTKSEYIDYKLEKITYESTMDFVVYTLQDIGYKFVGDNKNIQFNIFFDMFGNYGGREFMILRRSARNEIIVSNKNKELLVSMSFDSKTNKLKEICSIRWAKNKNTYMVEDQDIPELYHYISFGTLTESKVTEAVSGHRKSAKQRGHISHKDFKSLLIDSLSLEISWGTSLPGDSATDLFTTRPDVFYRMLHSKISGGDLYIHKKYTDSDRHRYYYGCELDEGRSIIWSLDFRNGEFFDGEMLIYYKGNTHRETDGYDAMAELVDYLSCKDFKEKEEWKRLNA